MEKFLAGRAEKIERTVEVMDIGIISHQMKELVRQIREGDFKGFEKFTQIHPEVKEYFQEIEKNPEKINFQELEFFLLILFLTPKPAEQKVLLDTYKGFLEKERSEKIKEEIAQYIRIQGALKEVGPEDRLSYFSSITLKEREQYQERIEEDLKKVVPVFRLWYFSHLSLKEREQYQEQIREDLEKVSPWHRLEYFSFITLEERKQYQEQIQKDLEQTTPFPLWHIRYFSHITPEERKKFLKQIQKELEELLPQDRLYYFSRITPEERKKYIKQIQNDLKKVPPSYRLEYFSRLTPEERKSYQEQIQKDLKEVSSHSRLRYFSHLTLKEREEYQEQIQKDLKEVPPDDILYYFSHLTPGERFFSKEAEKLGNRLESQLTSEIGDAELRSNYRKILVDYLLKGNSLIALDGLWRKKDKLALFLGLEFLSDFPLPALTWKLSKDQELTLLYILQRLVRKQKRGLLSGISLPFRPREKTVAGFEKRLVEWFGTLDFLAGLGSYLGADEFLEQHLNFIRETQRKWGIQFSTTQISFSFLKEIVKEIKRLTQEVQDKFQKLLGLEKLEPEKFQNFIKRWNGEIESILVLAQRLSQTYPEVKELLRQIVEAEIEGKYFAFRYNIENELIRIQLSPLLRGKPKEEWEQIIETYHKGVILLERMETKIEPSKLSEKFSLKEEERENIKANLHPQLLFNLPEFKELDQEEKDEITQFLLFPFLSKKEKESTLIKNIREFKIHFQGKIPEKYLSSLIFLRQFFEDFNSGEKTPEELLNTLQRLEKKLPEAIKETGFWEDDISQYLSQYLRVQIERPEKPKEKKKEKYQYWLCHTTDHPKTLLEIGKYPLHSGSCQSYDYAGLEFVKSLLGYVADAHIQAVVVREIEVEEPISQILSLDEGRNTAKVKTEKGEEKEIKLSKPVARAMLFLGEKDGKPVFVLQRNYSTPGKIDLTLAENLEKRVLEEFVRVLNEKHQLGARIRERGEKGIFFAGSRNPEGHYNDLAGGQRGKQGRGYSV